MVSSILSDYYRVPDEGLARVWAPPLSGEDGFFLFGPDVICYGKSATGVSPEIENAGRFDASRNANLKNSEVHLPFNPVQVVENLLRERYVKQRPAKNGRMVDLPIVRSTYYAVRELLPVSIRKQNSIWEIGAGFYSPGGRWISPWTPCTSASYGSRCKPMAFSECLSFGFGPMALPTR